MASKPKRMGRPSKPPVPGERVSLGLKVAAKVKRALDAAAARSGRSRSQEAESRLENSLKSDSHLMLVQGYRATPTVFHEGKMLIPVGYEAVALPINSEDRALLLDHFREQWAYYEEGTWPKSPVSGQRVSLGLRVTPELKLALDKAAAQSGTSQSEEAEWRLKNSLASDKRLMLVQGHRATPVSFHEGQMLIPIHYLAVDETVAVPISNRDWGRILAYFSKQWPVPTQEFLNEEIEEAGDRYVQMFSDIKRGK